MDLETIRSHLERNMQIMMSDNADLAEDKWTFQAAEFRATAGEHLIISVRDWQQLWRALQAAAATHSATGDEHG